MKPNIVAVDIPSLCFQKRDAFKSLAPPPRLSKRNEPRELFIHGWETAWRTNKQYGIIPSSKRYKTSVTSYDVHEHFCQGRSHDRPDAGLVCRQSVVYRRMPSKTCVYKPEVFLSRILTNSLYFCGVWKVSCPYSNSYYYLNTCRSWKKLNWRGL
jgi:hypothetical protein